MTQQPFNTAALHGAVDLSALARPSTPGGQASPAAGGADIVVEATDATFEPIIAATVRVPAVLVLWSSRLPASQSFVDVLADVARSYAGRFQLVTIDIDTSPQIQQAFQAQGVPVTVGLVQGQPVPLFAGVQPEAQVRAYVDELLKLAVSQGVTGRVPLGENGAGPVDDAADAEVESPLPPLHQEAYDAIERDDLGAAADAYARALAANPADDDAKLGLAQVTLMQRTAGVDLIAARAAAAAAPTDVAAQTLVADLDLLGGHIEDAFVRLVDLVRVTSGDERNAAREHLLQLFEVVGASDERVKKARGALMSALF